MPFLEFENFRTELRSLDTALTCNTGKTVRDDTLRERFRTLFRVWVSAVDPSIRSHLQSTRDFFKLSAEVEKLARLSSKIKSVADYRKRLRNALKLADSLVLLLPAESRARTVVGRDALFLAGIPDLTNALVPNAIVGWRSRLEAFVNEHPFDKSVFIMIRYRKRNAPIIRAVKSGLEARGLFGVVASEHSLTDDLYNPIACLLCCSRGIAVFDQAEQDQVLNPNVAYELGMLHLLGRSCLILKHRALQTLQTDILMKLYEAFSDATEVRRLVAEW